MLKSAATLTGVLATATLLTACGGRNATPTASGLATSPTTARGAARSVKPSHQRSWMNPAAKSQALAYVTDSGTNTVVVYSYPKLKLVGTLTGFDNPQGDCIDASGNVWIVNTEASQLLEYAHGGTTPIARLSDPGQYPVGCSFDPTTGHQRPSGKRVNLYAWNRFAGDVQPAELRRRLLSRLRQEGRPVSRRHRQRAADSCSRRSTAQKFQSIVLDHAIGGPGTVQAAGDRVVVGDQTNGNNAAYAFAIHGSKGALMKTTPLSGTNDVVQFNIYKNALVGADLNFSGSTLDRFKYPAGGAPVKSASGLNAPIGTVISP